MGNDTPTPGGALQWTAAPPPQQDPNAAPSGSLQWTAAPPAQPQTQPQTTEAPTAESLPGSTELLRQQVAQRGLAWTPATGFEKTHPQLEENYGFTPGAAYRGAVRGAKGLLDFGTSLAKDVSNPNKPLFWGEEAGPQESTFKKYMIDPQFEQFLKAQGAQTKQEAFEHYVASLVPFVGPWIGGVAERAGQTGDIGGSIADVGTQIAIGKAAEVGVEKGVSGATRLAGNVVENAATRMGVPPKSAEALGNIAAMGVLKPLDAHMEALDTAVNNHITSEHRYSAASQVLERARAAAEADPEDLGAQKAFDDAQKTFDAASKSRADMSQAVDKIQDKIISTLEPSDWKKLSLQKVGDIVRSTVGITSDFNEATTRFANMLGKQAGQKFKAALDGISEDLKAIINDDTEDKIKDPNTAADAIDQHLQQNVEAPLQQEAGAARDENRPVVSGFRDRLIQRLDKFFDDNRGKYGSPEDVDAIKQRLVQRMTLDRDMGGGVMVPRDPNLYEAENIRQGLNKQSSSVFEQGTSDGYRAAAANLADFMREVIDEGYNERGVKGVEGARAREAKLIEVAKALRTAQTLFQKQQSVPALSKMWSAAKSAGYVSTVGTILLHSPFAALGGLLSLWEGARKSNITDIAGNLERMKELAGREPNAKAVTPQFGEAQPVPPEPAPAIPNMPPPPKAPEAAVRPDVNHAVKSALNSYYDENTASPDATPYNEQFAKFLQEFAAMKQEVLDAKANRHPLTEAQEAQWEKARDVNNLINKAREAEDVALEKENQKRQAAYQKEVDKYNAKYQAEVAKATAKAKADAEAAAKKAETDAAAKSDALKNDPRIIHGAGGLMPATEPVRAIVGAGDHTSEQAHGHEGGGHTIAYASQGLDPFEFISDTHPKAIEKGAAAAIRTRIDAAAPGAEGVFQRVIGMLGGPAWDEVHSGIDPADNRAGRDDFNQAKKALREEAGLTPSEVDTVMEELYNTAKEVVSKPEAVALAKANIAVREVGLPDTHHMSETRMTDYVKALKGVFGNGETKTPTTDGRVSGEADESAPERESDLGGAKTEKPSGSAEKVPAGKVRASEGESEEGARGSGPGVEQANLRRTLETAREKKFKVSGTDEHGNPIDEEIYAHSFNKARKMAEAKHEGARQLAVDVTGESEPYGEYQLPKKKPMTTPDSRMEPDKESAEKSIRDTMIHELGHYMVGHNEGHTSKGMLRESHPDMPRGANAAISWDGSSIFDNGRISDEKLPGVLRTIAGGVAADEVFSNLPRGENDNFSGGGIAIADGAKMRQFLKAAGYPESGIYEMMNRAVDEAKEHLTKPHVRGVIEENIGTREPKLSSQYHFSPERLKSMGDEAARRGAQNGSGTEGSDNGTTGRPSNQTGGGNVGGGEGGAAPAVGEEAVTEPKSILDTAREQEHGVEQSNLSKAKAKDVLDKIVGKYGTSDNVEALRHDHSFILPDGKLVHLEGTQHGDAIADHGGGNSNEKNGWDNRPEFINKSGAVRAQGYQDRAGDSLSFSVPKDGVTREQADTMNRAASQPYMRNGNLKVERADINAATANELYRQKDFPRVGDIHEMLRQIGAHPDQVEQSNLEKTSSQVEEHEKNGGSTFTPEGRNLAGADTHAVAAYPERGQTVDQLTSENLAAFKQKNADVLAGGQHAVGTWKDPETGKTALDIVKTVADRDEAVKAGQDANQKAIYHLKTGETIPTGGTGEVPKVEQSNLNEDEGFNFGKNAEGTPDQQKGLISTALPKGKKAIADPLETDVRVGMESLTPKSEAAIADKIREMPGFRIPDAIKDPKKVIAKYIDQFKKNLIDVHNRVDPETRAATAKWYESANGIAQRTAEKFGKTLKQGAGILAALSPQKDWDQNVSLAERVNDIYHTKGDMRMTPEMRAKVDQLVGEKHTDEEGNVTRKNDKLGKLVDNIGDRTFNELSNPLEKAAFIRLYDEAHNSREFHRIDPGTGNRAEIVTTDSGAPRRIAWGSLNEISKAVSILEDGSRENISNNLGGSHKVRNFYNNILDPNNPAGHVTVDTHAVAAGHQRMLSGKSPEVKANFGGISAAETGLKGMYAVNAEAYRQAAKELGLQPRQLQSIVWEEIRKQFPDEYKRSTTAQAAIDGIWKEYEDGDITLKNAQQRVRDYAQKGYAEMVANKPAAKEAARPQANWDWEKIGLLPSNFVKSGK